MSEVAQSGGESKDGKVRSKKSSTKIDMTPMVDLAFLLLTFFMLTTTFNKPQTMEITMPEKPKPEDKQPLVNDQKVLTLMLGKDNKIYWYIGVKEPKLELTSFSKEGVRKLLLEKKAEIAGLIVLIKPTDESIYKNVVDILDEMNINDIKTFAMVDVSPTEKDLIKESGL
jgi:biopolymer transport protein ExbD